MTQPIYSRSPDDLTPCGSPKHAVVKARKPVRFWHESIIDDMLAKPFDLRKDRAARLGYSDQFLGTIMNSDMFRAAYRARREQYSDLLSQALAQKLAATGDKMLDCLNETLDAKRGTLPFAPLAETTLSILEKLGFGAPAKGGPQTVVNVQANAGGVTAVSAESLNSARSKLRLVEQFHTESEAPPPLPAAIPEGDSGLPPKPPES